MTVDFRAAVLRYSHRSARGRPGRGSSYAGADVKSIKIVTASLDEGLTDISAETIDGDSFDAVWVLVRDGGWPVGLVEMPCRDGVVTASALATRLAELPAERGATRTPIADGALPKVTIIVSTLLDREQELRRCLKSLAQLNYPRYEVLLIDNRPAPSAEPAPWLQEYDVRVISERTPGLSAARNTGLATATGEVVAFIDDDIIADPLWLRVFGEHFVRRPGDTCVTGLVLPVELRTLSQLRFEAFYGGGFGERRSYRPVIRRVETRRRLGIRGFRVIERDEHGHELRTFSVYAAGTFGSGGNAAYRTSALREAGGFRLELGPGTPTFGGEDLEVFARLAWRGHTLAYEPGALVYHNHRRDEAALRRQIYGYGVGFVASIVALVLDDPRHIVGIGLTVPRAIRPLTKRFWKKLHKPFVAHAPAGEARVSQVHLPDGADAGNEFARLELLGMLRAPEAYLRSRSSVRRRHPRVARGPGHYFGRHDRT